MPAIRLSAIRKSQPIELETQDNTGEAVVLLYSVKEMTGAERDAWLSEQSAKYGDGEKEVADYKGIYSTLLKYCFYGPTGSLVPESEIQLLPAAAQEALHGIALDVNGLKKNKAEDAEKN
jgi:hypothetical protein